MIWDEQKVHANIRSAQTEDLLDRICAFRGGIEPEAIAMIEDELQRRGVARSEITAYRQMCEDECVFLQEGIAAKCSFCSKPAVREAWGWHKLLGKIPVFPRLLRWCKKHAPGNP